MTAVTGVPWYRSIRLKLVIGAILVEIVMLGLLLTNSSRLLVNALEEHTRARLAALAPLLNASLSARVFQRDYAEIEAILKQLSGASQTEIKYIVIFDGARRPLAAVGVSDVDHLPPLDASIVGAMNDRVFDTEVPLVLMGSRVGMARLGVSLEALMASRDSVLTQGLMIAGAEVLLSLLLLTSGGYLLMRHVPGLLVATRRIARGDYASRVSVGSRDEVGILAADFNAMSAAVEERMRALQDSETRFREIFDAVGEAIFIHDPATGRILDVNRRMCEMYACTRDQIVGSEDMAAFSTGEPPYTAAEASGRMRRAATDGPQTFEWHARALDDRRFWVEVSLRLAHVGDAERIIAVVRDISERKQHEGELEYLAHHDALTRLPNRILLADRMAQAMAQSRRNNTLMAAGYLDLDGFKPVNDEMGHEAGDRLLVDVAERLKGCIREGDTLSRFGGDEFVVVLANLNSVDECNSIFRRILEATSQPYPIDGRQVLISASIGVSIFPFDTGSPDTLIRHADQAMYTAKQAGRNRLHLFDAHKDDVSRASQEARARVELALAQQELVLYYQPKVDLRDGRVLGVEALIRWQHPERGLLAPSHFLPYVNDTAFAETLGCWVLETAVAQLDLWLREGLDLTVSINLAARHLQSTAFVDELRAVIANHPAVPAGAVELEVLETAAIEDIARAARIIEACHDMGVRFALDDFGTGYASLSYFKSLDVDTLKIDQSFVRDMLDDSEDQAIVEGIIGLTRAFRRQVVAEGVETAAHCVALINLGCHVGQGYGIARPMPAEELAMWVRSRPAPAG